MNSNPGKQEDRNLRITGTEFGAKVKLHWIDEETGERGYTEVTHETYHKVFRMDRTNDNGISKVLNAGEL